MSSNWKVGDRIKGRWEIHDIKRGGMGVVYIVYDHEWKEAFAAKTFQDEVFARNTTTADRFTQEAITWVNLDLHQNITQARFVETIEGKPYLFLEYVSGGDLGQWVGSRLTADLPQVLRFAVQFCDGMTHALAKGVKAHRDIKPGNCLITEDGTLKVTDFGLAKVFDETNLGPGTDRPVLNDSSLTLSRTGTGAGTPPFMAPEQFRDAKHVDVRADIYSFGVMLYVMVAGKLPFPGKTWQECGLLHREAPLPSLTVRSLGDRENALMNSIIHTCMAKKPADRFSDFPAARRSLANLYEEVTGEIAPQPAAGMDLDAVALNNKGTSLKALGCADEALSCFDRALDLKPNIRIAASILSNKGLALKSQGRLDEAITAMETALSADRRSAGIWSNMGVMFAASQKHQEALRCFDQALRFNEHEPEFWLNRGKSLCELRKHQEALNSFEQALALAPNNSNYLAHKGRSLADLGRFDDALTIYDQTLTQNSTHVDAWLGKGYSLKSKGNMEAAYEAFSRATKLAPMNAYAWSCRGVVAGAIGRHMEALDCFDKALALKPTDGETWHNKGAELGNCGKVRDALACFIKAEQLGFPHAAEAIALCKRELGQYAKPPESPAVRAAKQKLAEASAKFPRTQPHIAALAKLGDAYADEGNLRRAETVYREAIQIVEDEMGPEFPHVTPLLNNLAHICQSQGCLAEAEQLYERAVAVIEKSYGKDDRNLGAFLTNLGVVYDEQGKHLEAQQVYERALAIKRQHLGAQDVSVAVTLEHLAASLAKTGKNREAAVAENESQRIRRSQPPPHTS